jgi:hypothetical protein
MVTDESIITVKDILAVTSGLKSITIKGHGTMRYGELVADDFGGIFPYKEDPAEMNLRALHLALKKADPELTVEQVRKIPMPAYTYLINALIPNLFGTNVAPFEP